MKKWMQTLAVLLVVPLYLTAQSDQQGVLLNLSHLQFKAVKRDFCFYLPSYPLATTCQIKTPGSFGLNLDYWRMAHGHGSPFFVQAGFGLRYFSNKVEEFEMEVEADTPTVVLSQEHGIHQFNSLYIHIPAMAGVEFSLKNIPFQLRAGLFADVPVFGTQSHQQSHIQYYHVEIVEDPNCQCRIVTKYPISQSVEETTDQWKESNYLLQMDDDYLSRIIGLAVALDVRLPLKGPHTYKAGYQYERVLNNPLWRSHKIKVYHSLALSVGFDKKNADKGERLFNDGRQRKGFIFGTQVGLSQFTDSYAGKETISGQSFLFSYNIPAGLRPEIRLMSWRGKYVNAAMIAGGMAFSFARGYVVPRIGFAFAAWSTYSSDLTEHGTFIYGGAGVQYPNTGWLRLELSANAQAGFTSSNNNGTFSPWAVSFGGYFFFGQ